jgi:NAD(P)-dependent dehydrogenase (short-subunit alcohol dehydrogenase family)
MTTARKPILLTGASCNLGRVLARYLAAQGMTLRLTDIAAFPDELPPRASFTRVHLSVLSHNRRIVSATPFRHVSVADVSAN